eukprot:6162944-Amphidinium_carterae.1
MFLTQEISAVLKDRTIPVEKEMEALGVAPNAKIDFNKFVKIMRKNYRGWASENTRARAR